MTSQCATFDFRYNFNSLTSANALIPFLTKWCKKWCFQYEEGETGYQHWQGRLSLVKKKQKHMLMELFRSENLEPPNYLEPTVSSEHQKGSMFYALKEDTRKAGPWTDANWRDMEDIDGAEVDFDYLLKQKDVFRPYTLNSIRFENLYPYQQKIVLSGLKENRDPRKIDLIVDTIGNKGKSTIATYLRITKQAIDMPACNDFDRLIFTLCDMLESRHEHDPKIILFDLPRALTKNKLNGFFCAFEQIKKGYLYDTRNKFTEWEIHPPRIWIFCNEMIDLSSLSQDRWNLWIIDDNKDLFSLTNTNVPIEGNLDDLDIIVENKA